MSGLMTMRSQLLLIKSLKFEKEVFFMIEMMIEVIFIAGTLLFAHFTMKRDAAKARRVYAIAFALLIAVCVAFCIAQGAAAAGFLSDALFFSPMEVLSLIAVVYWFSYVTARSNMFDKIIGE